MSYGDTVMMDDAADEPLASPVAATPASPAGLIGLLEVFDRNGATVTRLPVTHWPVTVGRALSADLVLDDGHVAAQHLRIEAAPSGQIVVQVLDTLNGVRRGKSLRQRGERFDWSADEDLVLGRLRLRLRLADMPIAAEQALPKFPWRTIASTLALVLAITGLTLVQAWFKTTEPAKFAQAAVSLAGLVLGGLVLWAGLWALATKLFTGHQQFWRHVRIACGFSLIEPLVSGAGYLLAFVFSWESLAQFNLLLSASVIAAGITMHLLVIAPQRRRGLIAMVTGATLLVVLAIMGTHWQQNRRWTNQLYLSALFPPDWRMAATVPVDQWMREAASIRQRLDARLKDSEETQADEEED